MSTPRDGYAFNVTELNSIWEIPCDPGKLVIDHQKAYEFHIHMAELALNPQRDNDIAAAERIVRAVLADQENPEPRSDA